jgi:hypothetical protein
VGCAAAGVGEVSVEVLVDSNSAVAMRQQPLALEIVLHTGAGMLLCWLHLHQLSYANAYAT